MPSSISRVVPRPRERQREDVDATHGLSSRRRRRSGGLIAFSMFPRSPAGPATGRGFGSRARLPASTAVGEAMSEDLSREARIAAEREEHARACAELRRSMIAAGVLVPAEHAIDPLDRRLAE